MFSFSHKNKIPQDIIDGKEFSYDEVWLEDMNVSSVTFNIDISISFMSDGTLDTCGDDYKNLIHLYGKDLKLFDLVLSLVINPYAQLEFVKIYNKRQVIFFNKIKRFIPVIEKHNLPMIVFKTSGNDNTIYSNIGVSFNVNNIIDNGITFYLDVLTWKMSIFIDINSGEDGKKLDINCSLEEFQRIIDNDIKEYNERYKDENKRK